MAFAPGLQPDQEIALAKNFPVTESRLSVAMATYNGEQYIREQLDSITCQELLPLELVVADDGSTDATLDIVERFARSAPFEVRVFRNEKRLGYADNFLTAASLCQGELIAFCDQDDIWMKRKLRVCSEPFRDPEVSLVSHSAWTLEPSGDPGVHFQKYARTRPRLADPFGFAYGFTIAFRRSLLDLMDFRDRPSRLAGHDQWIWFLAASTGKIARISTPLALYRQHQNNYFGVPRKRSLIERATTSIGGADEYADFQLACAALLSRLSKKSPELSNHLDFSTIRLKLRSGYQRRRGQIYKRESNLIARTVVFLQILLRGGYLPDHSRTRLGPMAAAKDMLMILASMARRSGH